MGRLAGTQIAAIIFSKAQETEADDVGTYMVALAGYDFRKSPGFMQRYAETEGASSHSLTHPIASKRVKALENTVEEIERKISANKPLLPERLRKSR